MVMMIFLLNFLRKFFLADDELEQYLTELSNIVETFPVDYQITWIHPQSKLSVMGDVPASS